MLLEIMASLVPVVHEDEAENHVATFAILQQKASRGMLHFVNFTGEHFKLDIA